MITECDWQSKINPNVYIREGKKKYCISMILLRIVTDWFIIKAQKQDILQLKMFLTF